jgi:glycosyltransferase involved in cell wall biosynthesis
MAKEDMPANRPVSAPGSEAYPLRVAYDAQSVVAPEQHIGKGAHLRNLLGPHIQHFTGLAPGGNQKPTLPIIQAGFSDYLLWQQSSLPRLLFSQKPDVFVAPFNTAPLLIPKRTKLLLVVHDLISFEKYPNVGRRFRLQLRYWSALISASVRRAFIVITVSEYSRQQILRRFPKARVSVLPNTIAESWYLRDKAIAAQNRDNYILMVTAASPHKNLDRGLQAYAGYVRDTAATPADLKIVGISKANAARLEARLGELGVKDRVRFMPYLSELELQELYRKAKVLFIPSLMEGFGIPVLEAMASGTPVISSSTTSLPEVGGSAPEYCDPLDVKDMSGVLKTVLADDNLRVSMAQRGLARAQTFHPLVVREQIDRFWTELAQLLRT